MAKISEKNREWVKLNRKVARAAASARGMGVSERDIFQSLRRQLAKPPSYRDLRAAFDHYSAKHLRIGGKVGQIVGTTGRPEARNSTYRDRRAAAYSPERAQRLARNYTMNALIVQGVDADQLAPALREGFIDWEESQSYERSPPV